MWKFTEVVCNFFALFVAGVLSGVLAYLVNPEFLAAIYTDPWGNACCMMIVAGAGVSEAYGIQLFGDLLMPSYRRGPWYRNPMGGAFLLVALVLLTIFGFSISIFCLRPIIRFSSLSSLGVLFQLLAITLLVLAFLIGMRSGSAEHNTPTDADFDEPTPPPSFSSWNPPPSKPSRYQTRNRD